MDLSSLLKPPFFNEVLTDVPWESYLEMYGMNPSKIVHGYKSMLHLWQGEGTRATKKYKEFALAHPDREVARSDEFDTAEKVATAVLLDPLAREVIKATKYEVTVRCEWQTVALQCRGRLDCYGDGIIADIKTTTDVSPDKFGRVAANLHYTSKLALYRQFVTCVTGEICAVKVIAAETKPPYDVVVYDIPEIVLDNAMAGVEKIMQDIPGCIKSGKWPGVAGGEVMDFPVPNWAMAVADDGLDWT